MTSQKAESIRTHFAPLISTRIIHYQTAELFVGGESWISWPDLPIRIYTDSDAMVSISWSKFDDLWLANDESLPFIAEDATTRWLDNGIPDISACLGRTIRGVILGRGQMSFEDREVEIWTRLVLDLDGRWLEIFNALDENGYELHHAKPSGEFVDILS